MKKKKVRISAEALQDRVHPDVIGWREYVALPEWNIDRIKAKADTGARTSAIDVANIVELDNDRVQFDLIVDRSDRSRCVSVETDIVRRTLVKSSFGNSHDRLIVRTRMKLGTIEKDVELSLVCRRKMLCRMLLGRKALEPNFVVDPGHCYLFGRKPRSRKKQDQPS